MIEHPLLNTKTPYKNLEPQLILDAIESIGIRCNGSLLALNSYENRVYQVGIEEEAPLIAKFYRPYRWSDDAILEEHQFAMELARQEIPVVPPLELMNTTLHVFQNFRFALFPRQGGRALELDNAEHLAWMGRFIGRLHVIGAAQTFHHRRGLNVETYGHQAFQYLLENDFIPTDIRQIYCHAVNDVLQKVAQTFEQAEPIKLIRLHGDCHAGNVLWNDQGPRIVDLDDCLTGPAIQDMWMLLSGGNSEERRAQLYQLLDGYEQFYDFNYREINLIEALRTLRMIHYSAWLARRWEDPAFPLNFPWFNTRRYWEEQLQHIREQSQLLDEGNEGAYSL